MNKLILTLVLAVLLLSGCSSTEPEILFDEATEGIVSVILKDYNDGTIHYDTIGPDGQRQPTQPFESEPLEILTAEEGCFGNQTDNQLPNKLIQAALTDESSNPVPISESLLRIFELAAQQQQAIQRMYILRQGEHHFASIEWNVNFWDPHALFYYDPVVDRLVELYTYDATQVIGVKALNLPCS